MSSVAFEDESLNVPIRMAAGIAPAKVQPAGILRRIASGNHKNIVPLKPGRVCGGIIG
jgi:hypothetical protein